MRWFFLLFLLLVPVTAWAAAVSSQFGLAEPVRDMRPMWSVESIYVDAGKSRQSPQMRLGWQNFEVMPWLLKASAGDLVCRNASTLYPRLTCNDGHIQTQLQIGPWSAALNASIKAWFNAMDGRWHLALVDQNLGRFVINALADGRLEIDVARWPILALGEMLHSSVRQSWRHNSPFLALQAELAQGGTGDIRLNGTWKIENLHFENAEGTLVLADVVMHGEVQIQLKPVAGSPPQIRVQIANARIVAGEALVSDVYFDFEAQPVEFSLQADATGSSQINRATFVFGVADVFSAQWRLAGFSGQTIPVTQGLTFAVADLSAFNRLYARDYLAVLGLEDMELSGMIKGEWRWRQGRWESIEMTLSEVVAQSKARRLQVSGLDGTVHWRAAGSAPVSRLRWDALQLAGVPIQATQVEFSFAGDQWRLSRSARLPVFDGELAVRHLVLSHLFDKTPAIDFSGELTPVSLPMVTEKLGWPTLHGTISGNIPGMRKHGESIVFDGALDVLVFDGTVRIRSLSMERIFGVAPVIAADIFFAGLNLQKITKAFDFGEITGLVSGSVRQLRVTNWKIDRMDAEIYSVPRKGIKQTLSQKALDRISSLGGVQGAISRSFLRFFQRFGYRRLGLHCRLRQNVCEMGGIRPLKGGYLLVEGGGVPRVNVVGYQSAIDWQVFIGRLLNRDYQQPLVR